MVLLIIPLVDVSNQTWNAVNALRLKLPSDDKELNLPVASKLNVDGRIINNKDFSDQDLKLARAAMASFQDVSFSHASLEEADFRGALFKSNVVFSNADLCGADLRGADLTGAVDLLEADLRFALVDRRTVFPSAVKPDVLYGIVYNNDGRNHLYQCHEGKLRILRADGSRG